MLTVVASSVLLFPLLRALPAATRAQWNRRLARAALRSIGIRVDIGAPDLRVPGGTLVVAGHVSWLDVLVLAAVAPGRFVARADLVTWPLLGAVARRVRVIPIERDRLRRLPDTVAAVRDRLSAGETVIAFPEGTTWCGRAFGRFRPALFQAAIDAQRPVLPLAVAYVDATGSGSTLPAFVGADTIGASMGRIIRSRGLRATVTPGELQGPGSDRRELANRCERQVRRGSHAVTDRLLARLDGPAHVRAA
ncbi:lyso-ornithine lipid acyltransferase [Rhodococcus sp. OK519]|nr:lyso-ornithine lipid acyltransferase [Rhodococcus sp. OK519]